MADNVMDGTAK